MRILGWLLLVGGLLLCVSIVWAAPGFFCMGLGLIFLQIAERKRRRAKSAASPPDQSEPQLEPAAIPEAARALVPPNANADARAGRENATGLRSYDTQKWRALLSSDGDIWRLANALEPYGQKYVDEFAAAYLAVNDKDHLPMILRQIIASARRDSAQNLATDFPDKNTNADAVAVANRTRRIDRVREMQSAYAEKSASVDTTPEVDADPERERVSQPSGPDFSGDVDASAACKAAAEEANPKPGVAGAERDVSTAGEIAVEASPEPPEVPDAALGPDEKKPTREVDAVDADNLTEILNQLNQPPTPKAE